MNTVDVDFILYVFHTFVTISLAGTGATLSVLGHFEVKENRRQGRLLMFSGAVLGVGFGLWAMCVVINHLNSG